MSIQIKAVEGKIRIIKSNVSIGGSIHDTASLTDNFVWDLSEEEAFRLLSDDMKFSIAEAKRFNVEAKRRKIDELESEARKLRESL